MSDDGYINRAFRPEPGRKYYNHLAKHSRGDWHRHWLLTSGQYIKTNDPDAGRRYGWKIVGEPGPELANFSRLNPTEEIAALICHCGRIACRHHTGNSHHRGTALWMPSEPGNRHWPGCGCP